MKKKRAKQWVTHVLVNKNKYLYALVGQVRVYPHIITLATRYIHSNSNSIQWLFSVFIYSQFDFKCYSNSRQKIMKKKNGKRKSSEMRICVTNTTMTWWPLYILLCQVLISFTFPFVNPFPMACEFSFVFDMGNVSAFSTHSSDRIRKS